MERFDVAVIGAGAAGLYCAGLAGQRGLGVVVLDHARRIAEKIRISGGGRCNFTNRFAADPARYLSEDPAFAATALAAHPPERFIARLRERGIGFHEKHRGQLFCDDSSQRVIDLLLDGCRQGRVSIRHPVRVEAVSRLTPASGPAGGPSRRGPRFELQTSAGPIAARCLVIATGGLSIPAIGATDFGWRLAAGWGLRTVAPRPALVPLTITDPAWAPFAALSGLSLPVGISIAGPDPVRFDEDLLFTHRGLSGPAALQISSYWHPGDTLRVDLAPDGDAADRLIAARDGRPGAAARPGAKLVTALSSRLPSRLAAAWLTDWAGRNPAAQVGVDDRLATVADAALRRLGAALAAWPVRPAGTEGYRKAEVTAGGVATGELDPLTLESRRVPGSFWIGEAVDVTGWLGGYNFQWSWSSGWSAAMAMASMGRSPSSGPSP